MRATQKIWHKFLEILFAAVCANCKGRLVDDEQHFALCRRCFESIEFFRTSPHPELIAVGSYSNDALRTLIFSLKFKRFTNTLEQIRSLIENYLRSRNDLQLEQFECITYIPLHPARERERGFNQAKLIAEILGDLTQLPIENTLKRVRNTKAQSRIKSAKKRLLNVQGCFSPRGSLREIQDKNILVVDDIYTSGATAAEAVRTLKKAGAKSVKLFVLARAR